MCGDRRFKKIRQILSPYVGDWNGRIALIFCYVSHSPAARLVLDKRGTRLPAERARLGDVGGEVPQQPGPQPPSTILRTEDHDSFPSTCHAKLQSIALSVARVIYKSYRSPYAF
jgi:hypothetical protein